MAYSDFTLRKAKEELNLTLIEGGRFLPKVDPIAPSSYLVEFMQESLPLAVATGSEKARSELIISPVLVEVRRILDRQVSVFSGEDFTVAPEIGLSGTCDFLLSQSSEQMLIEAPVLVIVEAKKGDLKIGIGQCIAEMVAAQRFNAAKNRGVPTIYGSITSGTLWRFLKLEEQTITADLTEYSLPPIDQILAMLVCMMKS
ncbi:hypothetical protein ACKFKF_17065 [Phormidesmis sp. 146-12]